MAKAKFKLKGRFNGRSSCTVTIDRGTGLVQVRPKHARKQYEMRLEDLAEIIIWRCVKDEFNQNSVKSRKKNNTPRSKT